MTTPSSLRDAIVLAAQSWPIVAYPGDPNTIDIYWHADQVIRLLDLKLPGQAPDQDTGVSMVEYVEEYFISNSLVRCISPVTLAERGLELVHAIESRRLFDATSPEIYAVALYTWHGCINMAKLLRRTYVTQSGEQPYTNDMRWAGYNSLQECWLVDSNRGNPWTRYGVSLARMLEIRRGHRNNIIEDWIPKDAPYWGA